VDADTTSWNWIHNGGNVVFGLRGGHTGTSAKWAFPVKLTAYAQLPVGARLPQNKSNAVPSRKR